MSFCFLTGFVWQPEQWSALTTLFSRVGPTHNSVCLKGISLDSLAYGPLGLLSIHYGLVNHNLTIRFAMTQYASYSDNNKNLSQKTVERKSKAHKTLKAIPDPPHTLSVLAVVFL